MYVDSFKDRLVTPTCYWGSGGLIFNSVFWTMQRSLYTSNNPAPSLFLSTHAKHTQPVIRPLSYWWHRRQQLSISHRQCTWAFPLLLLRLVLARSGPAEIPALLSPCRHAPRLFTHTHTYTYEIGARLFRHILQLFWHVACRSSILATCSVAEINRPPASRCRSKRLVWCPISSRKNSPPKPPCVWSTQHGSSLRLTSRTCHRSEVRPLVVPAKSEWVRCVLFRERAC